MIPLSFELLSKDHFPLLLRWLEMPHVKAWWDQDITWTFELITKKFTSYTQGYKYEKGLPKKIKSYIIHAHEKPIGYIQSYNPYDFARKKSLCRLPKSLAAFDMFLGEPHVLGKGLASQALTLFMQRFLEDHYEYIFANPDAGNKAAIRTYEKAGFQKIQHHLDTQEIWMLRTSPSYERKEVALSTLPLKENLHA